MKLRLATVAQRQPLYSFDGDAGHAVDEQDRTVRPAWRRLATSGWVPAALLVLTTTFTLWFYGVAPAITARFGLYLALGIALPGTLVWRAAHGGKGWFAADVAAGVAVGYVGEVFVYIVGRLIGLPLLVLAWPIGTVVVFLAVPRLRRYWRGGRQADRPPPAWLWSIAAAIGLTFFWSCKFFRIYGLTWPYNSAPDTDSTFHLALVGEAKHHMPLMVPWVSGEPLYYHWFVYPEMAATSWVTGIEPQMLLLRLAMLSMLAAFTVLVAALARKLTGGWWGGVAAVVITLFVLAPNPYGWPPAKFFTNLAFSNIDDGSALRLTVWTGPTQTFGALMFVPVAMVLVDLLRGEAGRGRWILFGVLLCAVMGAKATYLPLLLAGLVVVLAAELVFRRRLSRPALVAAAITLLCVIFAQFVLFGGVSQGLRWQPLQTMVTSTTGGSSGLTIHRGWWRMLVILVIALFCWVSIWAGVVGLFRRRLPGPEMVLMLALGVVGIGVTSLTGQDGDSQRYFLESGRPYLSLAAAAGLVALVPAGKLTGRRFLALAGAALGGLVVINVIRMADGSTVPTFWPARSYVRLAVNLLWPYAAAAFVVAVAIVAALVARRWMPAVRGMGSALVIAVLAGMGLMTTVSNFANIVYDSRTGGWRNAIYGTPIVSEGTLEAGRWLRDRSSPDDLVATNAHCLYPDRPCSNVHFSIAAYSERRMLVEGWGFTATAHEEAAKRNQGVGEVPYWKPQVLADNDAVFTAPSAENIAVLRDRYAVRWLFVDESAGPVSPNLGKLVTERYRSGTCVVYQMG